MGRFHDALEGKACRLVGREDRFRFNPGDGGQIREFELKAIRIFLGGACLGLVAWSDRASTNGDIEFACFLLFVVWIVVIALGVAANREESRLGRGHAFTNASIWSAVGFTFVLVFFGLFLFDRSPDPLLTPSRGAAMSMLPAPFLELTDGPYRLGATMENVGDARITDILTWFVLTPFAGIVSKEQQDAFMEPLEDKVRQKIFADPQIAPVPGAPGLYQINVDAKTLLGNGTGVLPGEGKTMDQPSRTFSASEMQSILKGQIVPYYGLVSVFTDDSDLRSATSRLYFAEACIRYDAKASVFQLCSGHNFERAVSLPGGIRSVTVPLLPLPTK
jgi:hypothetical protein